MNTQRYIAGPLSVLCIIALALGTASATVITTTGSTIPSDSGPALHHPSPESLINGLEQQGVDVTEVRTALQNGDTEAVKAWFKAHKPTDGPGRSPPDLSDPAVQEKMITMLEERGIDVTEVKALLQNGDTEAVKAWLEAHKPAGPDGSGRSPPDLTDPTQQQKILTRLESRGVDVTEVEAELQSGDTSAVKTWLETYLQAHEGEMPCHHTCGALHASSRDTGG